MELFAFEDIVGVFRGFREGGLEFHADLAIPYRPKLHNVPMHGQFLLVQLENPNEAVLGRITSISADGRLTGDSGEQYAIRAVGEGRSVPDHLREDYLKYRIDIRVLGVLRIDDEGVPGFVPSHRRLPHVGAPVAFPSPKLLQHIVGHHGKGAEIGFFALGEYVYSGHDTRLRVEPWMQIKEPEVAVRFPINNLVSRRTLIFARAGFGKSNLNKLLFSELYSHDPTVPRRDGRPLPVGTIIFDPDGEYFWPDVAGRPGFADVPALQDKLVVFTARQAPSAYYGSFVVGGVKLDIRRINPSDVISIALSPEKQDQQNIRKLRQLNISDWSELVDLVDTHGNSADLVRIQELLRLEKGQEMEALAARGNMTSIVRMLHDRSSQMMDKLLEALALGKLCVVDVSQLRGGPSLILSGLILRRIFDRNQEEFTKAESASIPTIAVVEEAQSVLNEKASAATPYIEWVKEGRKYGLGAVLITQQPGSIPAEILSQGDNWFVFHLLSDVDLKNVKRANAHFSDDILSTLLNEPIEGQGVYWSSVGNTKYPISLRVLAFEQLYERIDKDYKLPAVDTYAAKLRKSYQQELGVEDKPPQAKGIQPEASGERVQSVAESETLPEQGLDPLRTAQDRAIATLQSDPVLVDQLTTTGVPWGVIAGRLREALPQHLDDRDRIAFSMVVKAINQILGGNKDEVWYTERRGARQTLFIQKK